MYLKDYKSINNLTLEELSKKTGLSVSYLSKLINHTQVITKYCIEDKEDFLTRKLGVKIELSYDDSYNNFTEKYEILKRDYNALLDENKYLKTCLLKLSYNLSTLKKILNNIDSLDKSFYNKKNYKDTSKKATSKYYLKKPIERP